MLAELLAVTVNIMIWFSDTDHQRYAPYLVMPFHFTSMHPIVIEIESAVLQELLQMKFTSDLNDYSPVTYLCRL